MADVWRHMTGFLEEYVGLSPSATGKIAWTLVAVVVYLALRRLGMLIVSRRTHDVGKRYVATKACTYILGFLALVALGRIWLGGLTGLATFLGILSAGVAIALKDPLVNLVGWIYIVVRRPFTTGDRIQIGAHTGDVVDIALFQFTVVEIGNWVDADQSTGRIIHIPNGWVFQQAAANYTQGFDFLWNELAVTVTFESDWRKAKEILTRVGTEFSAVTSEQAAAQIRRASRRFLIFYLNLTPIVWTSVAANGVTLTFRYLCKARSRRSSAAAMWEEVLREFASCDDIDFAYPTTRFYRNDAEGKPGARAGPPAADGEGGPPGEQAPPEA